MLYPKPTVYWVYFEDESDDCVTQLLQLINFNKNTFHKNTVSLLPTQQVMYNLKMSIKLSFYTYLVWTETVDLVYSDILWYSSVQMTAYTCYKLVVSEKAN